MKIKMLDTVEDANQFQNENDLNMALKNPVKSKSIDRDDDGKLVRCFVTNTLLKGKIYDVPDSQGKNLIRLKFAQKV